jgi:hypothetical protein
MTIDEKRELRITLLKELYDHNEETGGDEKEIPINTPTDENDKNMILAYEYLKDKGLISFKLFHKTAYTAKITSVGIDYVEEALSNQK